MRIARVEQFWPQMSLIVASLLVTACGGGGGGSASTSVDTVTPPARAEGDPRGVSGTVANVVGAGLVLQLNGGNDVNIPAGAQGFSFPTQPEGSEYRITIQSQPSGQACTLLRGAGIVGPADITDVTINCTDNVTDALAGTYALVSENTRDFVTFNADGTFVLGSRENDQSCGANNGNGIEYGVYNWDADTGNFFVVDATIDTNGECGLFDENNPEASAVLLLRAADGSLSVIDPQDNGGAERFTLKPVASVPTTIIGSFGVAGAPDFAVFATDGTYFVATTQSDPVSGTTVGIEEACYTTGTSSGAPSGTFQTTTDVELCGVSPIDTNGTAGFSDETGTTQFTLTDANTLRFTDDAGTSTLTRILPNTFGIPDRDNILAGTYFSDLGVTGNRNFITFYPDGSFVLGSHENDQACGTTLGNGVEYGVYRWNRASSAFQFVNVVVDTNGVCGAADVQGTLVKTADGFTFTDSEDGEQTVFTVVLPSLGTPLLGSSKFSSLGASNLSGPDFVVFTDDGRYFQVNTNSENSTQPSFVPGIEDGCYSDNGSTFVVDLLNDPIEGCAGAIDTNGSAGLSSFEGSPIPYQTTGADTLRFFLGQFEQNDLLLTRMFPNSLDPLVGTYAINGGRAFIHFYDDGAYAVGAHNFDPRLTEIAPADLEFGVYSWNRATGKFGMLARTLDTDSDTTVINVADGQLTMSIEGTLTVADGDALSALTPVESTPDALIGSFFFNPFSPRSVAVFARDGSYFLMDLSFDGETGQTDIEDGCYAALPETLVSGTFSPSVTRCLSVGNGLGTIDTNPFLGLPDGASIFYLRLDPNTLQLQFDFDRGGGVLTGGGV